MCILGGISSLTGSSGLVQLDSANVTTNRTWQIQNFDSSETHGKNFDVSASSFTLPGIQPHCEALFALAWIFLAAKKKESPTFRASVSTLDISHSTTISFVCGILTAEKLEFQLV